MTSFPEDLFAQIYKRSPNSDDRDRLVGVKSALGLSSRDEMWPVLMTLDHYSVVNQAARTATVKEVRGLLDELKDIPAQAGLIASAEAQRAIQQLINEASDKIAHASAQKSITTVDRISKKQFIIAAIVGGIVSAIIAAAGAAVMYVVLDARGICAEPPVEMERGDTACIVHRSPG